MKLNFDKEKLLKHKFWIMLLVAVPLILFGQFILLFPVAGEINKTRKDLESAVKAAINSKPTAYNAENLKQKQEEVDKSVVKEYETWKNVWDQQDGCRFWPDDFEKGHPMQSGKFLRELKYIENAAETKDDEHHFTGKLLELQNLYLVVQGKDGKKERFYRAANEDMKLPDAFFNLLMGKDVHVTFQTGRYFNDKLNDNEQTTYLKEYFKQIRPIVDIVRPVNDEGEGVVQLKGWLAPSQKKDDLPPAAPWLRFVPRWKANQDISEDAWLAQEDLWITKEIFRLVRQANDYVGMMTGSPVEGLNKSAIFRNLYFQVELKLLGKKEGKEQVEVTVKNLQDQRQKLDVRFEAKLSKKAADTPDILLVDSDPLDPKGSVHPKTGKPTDEVTRVITLKPGVERTGIYAVEQMLTWETAAVRRIDSITIGAGNALGGGGPGLGGPVFAPPVGGGVGAPAGEVGLNHRTFPDGLKPLVEKKVDVIEDKGPKEGGPGLDPRFGPGGPGGPNALGADFTPNGLLKTRYSETPTQQTRRLPVAVALIVDQTHIDRVLTSFNNSKLRFLTSQLMINRYPLSIRPNILATKLNPNQPFMPKGGGLPFMPPVGPGGPVGGASGGGDEDAEANIELVIYGTVTLYQRFPPRTLPTEEAPK